MWGKSCFSLRAFAPPLYILMACCLTFLRSLIKCHFIRYLIREAAPTTYLKYSLATPCLSLPLPLQIDP